MEYGMTGRHHGRCAIRIVLLAIGLAGAQASAQAVFKCRAADGAIAYQDHSCAAGQRQSEVVIDPAPAAAPQRAPDPARSGHPARAQRVQRHPARVRAATAGERSWLCRGADGSVFYRHSACPKSIAARAGEKKDIGVSAVAVARADACRELARAGAIGRRGHAHDEVVSTYERNAGHDPCRRY